MVTAATAVSASPVCSGPDRPSRSAMAVRSSSRQRSARTAATAAAASSCRPTSAAASACSAARSRGASWASLPSQATVSGWRSSRPAAYRLEASSRAIRCATVMSSRSSRRYHGLLPRASLTWWNASSPASGSAASANQPSISGSSVRWMAARRDTPAVSVPMCRSAPAGSA